MGTYKRPLRSDELMHHGIKGQRWGVRRYQNPDGSYTAAGRKRYLNGVKKRFWDSTGANVAKSKIAYQRSNNNADLIMKKSRSQQILDNAANRMAKSRIEETGNYKKMDTLLKNAPNTGDISDFREWQRTTKEGKQYYKLYLENKKITEQTYAEAKQMARVNQNGDIEFLDGDVWKITYHKD